MFRPDDVPNLKFERFNPNGNSPDAVVYISDRGLLVYDGKRYEIDITIEDDFEITDVFQRKYKDDEEPRLIIQYKDSVSLRQARCGLV